MAERHSDCSLDCTDGGADASAPVKLEIKLVHVRVIPRIGQAPSAKKFTEVTTCNKSPSVNALMTNCDEMLLSCDTTQRDDLSSDAPTFIEPEKCTVARMQDGYNSTSTKAIVQAIESNDKHTLSLGGRSLNCQDTMFKEYSHVCNKQDGSFEGVYFYECCKYPGHYIRWYCDEPRVDCEPNTDIPHTSYFQWQKKAVNDNSGLNYSLLMAYDSNPSSVSPAYLTFEEPEQQPMIQTDVDKASKFLISYPSAQTD